MNGQLTHPIVANTKGDYASCEDLCNLFATNMKSFYLLSFLLTASREKAEHCFVAGLDDCVNGISVFQGWIDCWARRLIVRSAVRLMQPRPSDTAPGMWAYEPADEDTHHGIASQEALFARVLALNDFERFAFVLSVLEGYPDQSCAIFLETSRQQVQKARIRAFEHLGGICSSPVASLCFPFSFSQQRLS
jgi:hypothetical protein